MSGHGGATGEHPEGPLEFSRPRKISRTLYRQREKAIQPVSTDDIVKLVRRDRAGDARYRISAGRLCSAAVVLRSEDEPDRDRALELKTAWLDDACELVVPSLWVFEVGSILGLKHPATAATLLQAMLDLGIREETPHGYAAPRPSA